MPRRSRSRGRGRRSRSYRGGAGAANPASYSDGQSYMLATVGGTNQQYDNVFLQGGQNAGQSNAIQGLQGQHAGGRRRRRSNKRGGSFVTDAIVPAAFLAGTYLYSRRRGNKGSSRKRSFRRRR